MSFVQRLFRMKSFFHQMLHICFHCLFFFKVKLNETANKTQFYSWFLKERSPWSAPTVYSFALVFATFQHVNFPVMENSQSHKPFLPRLRNQCLFLICKAIAQGRHALHTYPEVCSQIFLFTSCWLQEGVVRVHLNGSLLCK